MFNLFRPRTPALKTALQLRCERDRSRCYAVKSRDDWITLVIRGKPLTFLDCHETLVIRELRHAVMDGRVTLEEAERAQIQVANCVRGFGV
jgi:hypothetical protein